MNEQIKFKTLTEATLYFDEHVLKHTESNHDEWLREFDGWLALGEDIGSIEIETRSPVRTKFKTMEDAQEYFEDEIYTGDCEYIYEDFDNWLQDNNVEVEAVEH